MDEARDGPDASIRAIRQSLLLEAEQHLFKRSPSSRLLCLPLGWLCRKGHSPPPAVGPLSSESSVPALLRSRRCLLPTQTLRVCLLCRKLCASQSFPPMPFIASIILHQVALIVAAVDEGGLILARRLRSPLVSAASLLSAPTCGSFGSAVIGALSCAIARSTCDNVCLALDRQCLLGVKPSV